MNNIVVPQQNPKEYRADIDGLRAVSVLVVLAFHLGVYGFSSGYVGVDVFFVISGYLITRIVTKDSDERRFSFVEFYVRRIRRILPALTALILFCAVVGFFILSPGDYAIFAKSALSALSASSNFFFLYNTGYFDAAAASMPLLHTWSLAIEEQFYFLWPTVIFAVVRFTKGNNSRVRNSLLALGIISFAVNLIAAQGSHLIAFYMPQNRAWELIVGGVLALGVRPLDQTARSRWIVEGVPFAGLVAIIISASCLPSNIGYPGAYALLPVLGAVALLWPTERPTVVARLLSTRIPVFLGMISYSLYLYHWPILIFWRHYLAFAPITWRDQFSIAVISCIVSCVSWRFIEQRFRWSRSSRPTVLIAAATSQVLLASLCGIILVAHGAAWRIPESIQAIGSNDAMWAWQCPHTETFADADGSICAGGKTWSDAREHIVVWGDSNAYDKQPVLARLIEGRDASIIFFTGCSPIIQTSGVQLLYPTDRGYTEKCDRQRSLIIDFIRRHPEVSTVVLLSAWSAVTSQLVKNQTSASTDSAKLEILKEGLNTTLSQIAAPARQIVFVSEIPKWFTNPIPCLFSQQVPLLRSRCPTDLSRLSLEYFDRYQKPVRDVLVQFGKENDVRVVLPEGGLCNSASCTTIVNGEFIYRDEGHLRRNLKPKTLHALGGLLQLRSLFD